MNEEILKLYKSIVQSNQEMSQDVTQEQQQLNETKLVCLKENYQQQHQSTIKREVSLARVQQTSQNSLKRQHNNDQLTAAEM
jgi:site-specific DNA-adenine methylase